jgi:peptide/nickel transport system permease protein
MLGYIVRRLIALIPILFGISILVFAAARVMPGNIAQLKAGQNATPEQVAELEHQYGLDKPMVEQYFDWLGNAAHLDLGKSLLRNRPVTDEILSRLPVTGQLLIMTMGVSSILGLTIGIVSATNYGRPLDSLLRGVSILGMSVPTFWVATLVILLPSIYFSYAPPFSHVGFFENPWDNLRQYGPPSLVLGFASGCGLARIVRGSILGVVGQDFMRTARAKGLRESVVIRRHALGNVMLPIITILGMEAVGLLGGTVIIEQVFNLNGLGRLLIESALSRDYPAIQAMALVIGVAVMLLFLLIDIAYAWLDPRVRLTGGTNA